jgi:hypothetical protein
VKLVVAIVEVWSTSLSKFQAGATRGSSNQQSNGVSRLMCRFEPYSYSALRFSTLISVGLLYNSRPRKS